MNGGKLPRFFRAMIGAVALGCIGAAGFWSLRLGYADYLAGPGDAGGLRRAIMLTPGRDALYVRLSTLVGINLDDQASAARLLESAVKANPRNSAAWIELGLRAEAAADFKQAEQSLLQAARADRQFDPAWTLANYYFRRGDTEKFWPWARRAVEMSYGDATVLFRLCWQQSRNPEIILNRAIPDRPETLARYLRFLLAETHANGVEETALRLAARAGKQELPLLLAACDRLIETRRDQEALRLWALLGSRRLIPYLSPDAARGGLLTNGDFREEMLSHGFDWRIPATDGATVTRDGTRLRVSFSGRQSETCELLSQYVPLRAGARHGFRFRYRTAGIGTNTGLRWRILDPATGHDLALAAPQLSSEDEQEARILFAVPPEVRLGRLVLFYERALGTTRIEGLLWLERARMEVLP